MGVARHFANNVAATTLNGLVSSSTTAWTVDDGSTYPTVPFAAKCESEIVLVTAVSGGNSTSWTVERAYDGTTGASHADATEVTDAVIADDMKPLPVWLTALGVRSDTADSEDDEFDDDSIDGAWTAVDNTGRSLSRTETKGKLVTTNLASDASAETHGFVKSHTFSTGDMIEAAMVANFKKGNYPTFGLVIADGTTYGSGKQVMVVYQNQAIQMFAFSSWNSRTGYSADSVDSALGLTVYLRLKYDATNSWRGYYSFDGVAWVEHSASPYSQTLTPSYWGLVTFGWGFSSTFKVAFEYFRVNPT